VFRAAKTQAVARARPSGSAGSSGAAGGDVQDDRAGLEEHEAVVLDDRDLAEGLAGAVLGDVDLPVAVGHAGLLEGPAHAQVARQALGKGRHPLERGQGDRAGVGGGTGLGEGRHRRVSSFLT
jgi:hypothetical protein